MATLKEKLEAIEAKQDETLAAVGKIGTETDGLKTEIQELKDLIANTPEIPQEISDKVDSILTKSESLAAAVAAVDAKVEDAPATPEEPTV